MKDPKGHLQVLADWLAQTDFGDDDHNQKSRIHEAALNHILRHYELRPTRTDQQIVDQTEELAADYMLQIYSQTHAGPLRDSLNPRASTAWALACFAQCRLTDTDPEDAAANLEPPVVVSEKWQRFAINQFIFTFEGDASALYAKLAQAPVNAFTHCRVKPKLDYEETDITELVNQIFDLAEKLQRVENEK